MSNYDIHSCGYYCDQPACIVAQRNELRDKLFSEQPDPMVLHKLARRCLWIAYVWNDHNFDAAYKCARKTAEECGVHSFDDANDWLNALPPQREWVDLTDEEIEEGQKQSWVSKQAFESAVWWAMEALKEKNA
jgi:hypothetical protein